MVCAQYPGAYIELQTTAETAKDHNGALVTSGSLNNKVGWEGERGEAIISTVVPEHKWIRTV